MTDPAQLYEKYLTCTGVSTDTRQILPGSLFFALKGPQFNANTFAAEALARGARFAVVDEAAYATDDRCVLVDDSLQALQALATFHRRQLQIPVVGLTGSNGKTTSKELLHAVLSTTYRTFATKGNLNNHIGVPLSVLSITSSHEMAIIEMGANHVGEIAALSAIAQPTHGFITNIGKAHIGTFGGFENIIRGKSELYDFLLANKGQVFVNSQNSILVPLTKRFLRPWTYPAPGDDLQATLLSADPFVRIQVEGGHEIQTQLSGGYNFENIAVALCVGKYFGVDPNLAQQAVAGYRPGNMRSQVMRKGSNVILLDAYNANPTSMAAAIENLAALKVPKKVAILGDMFELEEEAEVEHRRIAQLLREKKFDQVFLVGALFRTALPDLPEAQHFDNKATLCAALQQQPLTDATILVKASRGIGLESVVDVL